MFKTLAKLLTAGLAALLIAAAPGCNSIGLPAPVTSEERVVVTLATVAGVRDAAATLLKAKQISVEDAENIQRQADSVRAGVEIARAMIAVDPAGADAKLQQTRLALAALQAYLATKEKQR